MRVNAAISLTDRLLDEIEADDDSTLRVWSSIAEKGVMARRMLS